MTREFVSRASSVFGKFYGRNRRSAAWAISPPILGSPWYFRVLLLASRQLTIHEISIYTDSLTKFVGSFYVLWDFPQLAARSTVLLTHPFVTYLRAPTYRLSRLRTCYSLVLALPIIRKPTSQVPSVIIRRNYLRHRFTNE